MANALTRRSLVSAAPAAAVAATLPALAVNNVGPDAELLQLAKDFDRLLHEWQDLEVLAERLEPAISAHFDKSTPMEALWRERKETGYEEAVSIASDKVDEVDVVANRMRELPAQTLQGLAAKARLAQFDVQPRSFIDMAGPERDWDWDVLCLEKFVREIERFASSHGMGGFDA